jgi:uncharacterized protein (DUF2164 family)
MLKKFDNLPEETKKQTIEEIITQVEEITGSKVGIIAAGDIFDIVVQNMGPDIYNLALQDAKKLLHEKFTDLEYDIDALEQQT